MSALAKTLDGQSHVIGEMRVDFRFPTKVSAVLDADDLAWQVRQEMLPALETAIDEVDPQISDLRLDHLEIDLGNMPAELDWPRIRKLLHDQLVQALKERAALKGKLRQGQRASRLTLAIPAKTDAVTGAEQGNQLGSYQRDRALLARLHTMNSAEQRIAWLGRLLQRDAPAMLALARNLLQMPEHLRALSAGLNKRDLQQFEALFVADAEPSAGLDAKTGLRGSAEERVRAALSDWIDGLQAALAKDAPVAEDAWADAATVKRLTKEYGDAPEATLEALNRLDRFGRLAVLGALVAAGADGSALWPLVDRVREDLRGRLPIDGPIGERVLQVADPGAVVGFASRREHQTDQAWDGGETAAFSSARGRVEQQESDAHFVSRREPVKHLDLGSGQSGLSTDPTGLAGERGGGPADPVGGFGDETGAALEVLVAGWQRDPVVFSSLIDGMGVQELRLLWTRMAEHFDLPLNAVREPGSTETEQRQSLVDALVEAVQNLDLAEPDATGELGEASDRAGLEQLTTGGPVAQRHSGSERLADENLAESSVEFRHLPVLSDEAAARVVVPLRKDAEALTCARASAPAT